jgi:hypothetical protein
MSYLEKNYFMENKNLEEIIVKKIKQGNFSDILLGFCKTFNETLIIDFSYFKYIANKDTYEIITNLIIDSVEKLLKFQDSLIIHINMKKLTIHDLDKHKNYIYEILHFFKLNYPDKLSNCYIYNAPFIFDKLIKIINRIFDKKTQDKIKLVS